MPFSPWFDKECAGLKTTVMALLRNFELHPCDETRALYVQGRRDLRCVLCGKERRYSQERAEQFLHDIRCDPRHFWDAYKGGSVQTDPPIQIDAMRQRQSLLANTDPVQETSEVQVRPGHVLARTPLGDTAPREGKGLVEPLRDRPAGNPELDAVITQAEVESAVRSMKAHKGTGADGIPAEFFSRA
jgi:hypothetical protein